MAICIKGIIARFVGMTRQFKLSSAFFYILLTMLLNNLLAVAALVSAAFAAPAEKRQTRKMKYFGINESGAEFGETKFPGVYGVDYTWYDLSKIDQFMSQGMNMIRLNFCKSFNLTVNL